MKTNFIQRYYDAATGEPATAIIAEFKSFAKQAQEINLEQKTAFEGKLVEIKTAFEKQLTEKEEALQTEVKAAKKQAEEAQKTIDEINKKGGTHGFGGGVQTKTFASHIEEKLSEHKSQLGKKQVFDVALETKAVGNFASATSLTGSYFVQPDVRSAVQLRPFEQIHMRNLLPVGNTTSNVVRHLRDNGGEGGPAMVAEGGTKPQMDRDFSIEDASVRKIGTHLRVPEEMIEDIPWLTGVISNIGVEEVMAVEDAQILYGAGTGQNLSGLMTNATAFAAGATMIVPTPNRFDVLRAARTQMRIAKRTPSWALVSPTDYYVMTSAKDTTGNYILQSGGNGIIPTLDGVPVIEMTQMADGDFLLGDRLAAEIDFRQNVNVRFYDQDQDDAIKNMVTIVIEERLALPIYYTAGFVKGTFSAAITDLTS